MLFSHFSLAVSLILEPVFRTKVEQLARLETARRNGELVPLLPAFLALLAEIITACSLPECYSYLQPQSYLVPQPSSSELCPVSATWKDGGLRICFVSFVLLLKYPHFLQTQTFRLDCSWVTSRRCWHYWTERSTCGCWANGQCLSRDWTNYIVIIETWLQEDFLQNIKRWNTCR